jgi:hypothetical protein
LFFVPFSAFLFVLSFLSLFLLFSLLSLFLDDVIIWRKRRKKVGLFFVFALLLPAFSVRA